jgi:hypothetical protein
MAKTPIENPELLELGKKSRSGRIVSDYIRAIGSEKTEMVRDPDTGKTKIVSKAEAVARRIWEKAMGLTWNEETDLFDQGEISLDWMKVLLERAEGKAGVSGESVDTGKPTAADKVSEINKRRMNAMAEGGGDE